MSWKTAKEIFAELSNKNLLKWQNLWVQQTYEQFDMVLDDAWLMVANKETNDTAAPQPIGDPEYGFDGTFITQQASTNQLIFGQRYYTLNNPYFVSGYRVHTIAGNKYTIYQVIDPAGVREISELISFTATTTDWVENDIVPVLLPPNRVFDMVAVVAEPDPTTIETTANYIYSKPTNPAIPADGQIIHASKELGVIDISYTDDDLVDRAALIQGLSVGSQIEIGDTVWAIQSNSDQGFHAEIGIAPARQSSTTGLTQVKFIEIQPDIISYDVDVDFYIADPQVDGLFSSTGGIGGVVLNDNAYGMDIRAQDAYVSPDWDVAAYSREGTISSATGMVQAPNDGRTYVATGGKWIDSVRVETNQVYTWSTDTSATQPASFHLKGNNSDLSLITEMYVTPIGITEGDLGSVVGKMVQGDIVLIANYGIKTEYVICELSADAINNTGWFTLPVTVSDSFGDFSDEEDIYVRVYETGIRVLGGSPDYKIIQSQALSSTQVSINDATPEEKFNIDLDLKGGLYELRLSATTSNTSTNRATAFYLTVDGFPVGQRYSNEFNDRRDYDYPSSIYSINLTQGLHNFTLIYGIDYGAGAAFARIEDVTLMLERKG